MRKVTEAAEEKSAAQAENMTEGAIEGVEDEFTPDSLMLKSVMKRAAAAAALTAAAAAASEIAHPVQDNDEN